jgi:N-acetylneuraminic acid mutarotase
LESDKIYIFGGESKYLQSRNKRELFNDIFELCLSAENGPEFTKLIPNGLIPEGRKHHAGVVIGKYLYFHGGIDQNGKVLNEFIMFDTVE